MPKIYYRIEAEPTLLIVYSSNYMHGLSLWKALLKLLVAVPKLSSELSMSFILSCIAYLFQDLLMKEDKMLMV